MPFCVVKSKAIKFTLIMLLVAILLAIGVNGVASAQVFFGYSTKKLPVYCVDTIEKTVAISFDASWGAEKTQAIIDTLNEYDASATFFLVGFWVDKYPEIVQAIKDAGLEIGCHSNTHPDLTTLSKDRISEEIMLANNMIKDITGEEVELFRCPFGAYNNAVIETIEALNMIPVQWDVDSLDWKGLSAQDITTRVLNGVKNGSIILCHNNADNIIPALTMILERLKMQGYKVVSVGELIYKDNYSVDRNGIQHQKVN
ncbi:MAG: polysaccharide deacetylase family protein [Clostridia bacterium]|nr:polysaccharide deacetylase family protein [Clostridia bacterium]